MAHQIKSEKEKQLKFIKLQTLAVSNLIDKKNSDNFDIIFKMIDSYNSTLFGINEDKKESENKKIDLESALEFLNKG